LANTWNLRSIARNRGLTQLRCLTTPSFYADEPTVAPRPTQYVTVNPIFIELDMRPSSRPC